jgi:hypothetical protein
VLRAAGGDTVGRAPASSFRDLLLFLIGFAIGQNRDLLLRRLLTEHIADDARQQLAKKVVEAPGAVGLRDRRRSTRSCTPHAARALAARVAR